VIVETPAVPSGYTLSVRPEFELYLSTTLLPLTVPSPIVPGPDMVAVTDSRAAALSEAFFSCRASVAAAVADAVETAALAEGSPSDEYAADATSDCEARAEIVILAGYEVVIGAATVALYCLTITV